VWNALVKIDTKTNTVDIDGLGVFEISVYLNDDLKESAKDQATNVKVVTGTSSYYFPIQ
jgi:hypothetical protein